jgi:hypothetical protein
MGSLRGHRGLLAWVAFVALFGNVLVGIICPLPLKAQTSDYPTDLLGPLILCSRAGHEPTPADDGATPDESSRPCPLCITASVLHHALPSAAPALEYQPAASEPVEFAAAVRIFAPAELTGLGSRGPPLQA